MNTFLELGFDSQLCNRICLTLVHSLWQVSLLAACAVLLVGRLRRDKPERGYAVYVGAMLLAIAALPVTYWQLGSEMLVVNETLAATNEAGWPAQSLEVLPPREIAKPRADSEPVSSAAAIVSHQAATSVGFAAIAPWLLGVYLLGVVVMLLRVGQGVWKAQRLASLAQPISSGPLVATLERLACSWSLLVLPRLAEAQHIIVPQVVGLLRPTILIPTSALTGLTASELEMILAHELAHVRRHDMWVNLLQRLAEAVLFFNPALWYLSRQISIYREYCCDEQTCRGADQSSPNRVQYAQALLRIVELSGQTDQRPELAALAASGGRPSELRRRVARLFGEPLREPIRVSRSGLLALVIGLGLMAVAPLSWQNAAGPNVTTSSSTSEVPTTNADLIVAEARKKTFGMQNEPRVLFQQIFRQAEISTMQGVEDGSLVALWQARSRPVEDSQLDRVRHDVTLAWDDSQLLIKTDSPSRPGKTYIQSQFWDGKEGWLGEVANGNRHVYRYKDLAKLTEHVAPFYFPQLVAAGGRLPWSGPTMVLSENEIAPENTRYRLVRTETIDGISCDVYEGPERQETIWIDQTRGLVKAISRHYVFDFTEVENLMAIRIAAGREFADHEAYLKWYQALGTAEQLLFSARWAAATWPRATPGNLAVFGDYHEIAPGVQWPMKAERIHVRTEQRDGKKLCYFTRAEVHVHKVDNNFAIRELAADALPDEGVEVTDRRDELPVDYMWATGVTEQEITELQAKKISKLRAKEEEERQINQAPIESVAAAIRILTDGPKTDPTMIWARAIKYLVDHKGEALPMVIVSLDQEDRDHPISKLAFALRAMGDPRAVPALIRALPRTLQPSRSDYGLQLKDRELSRFMQLHDLQGKMRPATDGFDYGRAFREVSGTLQRLTGQNHGETELNWIRLAETESQRAQQHKLFQEVALRWATWWEENWDTYVDEAAFSKVNLKKLEAQALSYTGRQEPPVGPGVGLSEAHDEWIVPSVHETAKRCFVDLDTGREMDCPAWLPNGSEIGLDSPEVLAWVRREGIDLVGVSHKPEGEEEPLYCLHPFDMHVWKLTEGEHRELPISMIGSKSYPINRPVTLMVPRRKIPKPYDYQYSGDTFLFVTREGTAGVVRMTAQVTEARDITGYASSRDDMFSSVGFYRGAKISFAAITEP